MFLDTGVCSAARDDANDLQDHRDPHQQHGGDRENETGAPLSAVYSVVIVSFVDIVAAVVNSTVATAQKRITGRPR